VLKSPYLEETQEKKKSSLSLKPYFTVSARDQSSRYESQIPFRAAKSGGTKKILSGTNGRLAEKLHWTGKGEVRNQQTPALHIGA